MEKAIRSYKIFALPVVSGVSNICEMMGTKPLNADEKTSGENAIAAVFYQEGAALDARLFLMLWGVSVIGTRAGQVVLEKRKARRAAEARTTSPEEIRREIRRRRDADVVDVEFRKTGED